MIVVGDVACLKVSLTQLLHLKFRLVDPSPPLHVQGEWTENVEILLGVSRKLKKVVETIPIITDVLVIKDSQTLPIQIRGNLKSQTLRKSVVN